MAREGAESCAANALNRMLQGVTVFCGPPTLPSVAICVFPTLSGWAYTWSDLVNPLRQPFVAIGDTERLCAWHAINHFATQAVNADSPESDINIITQWASKLLKNDQQANLLRAELVERVSWLRRYNAWIATGVGDMTARRNTCERRDPPEPAKQAS